MKIKRNSSSKKLFNKNRWFSIWQKSRPLIIIIVVLVILVKLLGFFWDSLKIKKIIVISPFKKVIGLSVLNNKNLLSLNNDQVAANLLEKNVYLKNISLQKIYPAAIALNLSWREPVAVIENSNTPLYIDDQGYPAASEAAAGRFLPQIETAKISFDGKRADWRLVKAVTLLKDLEQKELPVEKLVIDDASSVIKIIADEPQQVTVPLNADSGFISASLQTIISRFRIEGKFISTIDFRFDKPVVVLKNE